MKIAAVGDVHIGGGHFSARRGYFSQVNSLAEAFVITGDLTNYGTKEEMAVFLQVISDIEIPVITVLGNHDFECGQETELMEMLNASGVHLLDGDSFELGDVGFAGTKGFGGGFGRYLLAEFGEKCIKGFVRQSQHEAEKLQKALGSLKTQKKIAITHYAPIKKTIEGEPESIHPFLGSSHLEEVLDEYQPVLALHGHAHKGSYEGQTRGGVRVCNVALPILQRQGEENPFVIFDV